MAVLPYLGINQPCNLIVMDKHIHNLKLCDDQINSSKILEQENSPQIIPNAFLMLMKSLSCTPLRVKVPKRDT